MSNGESSSRTVGQCIARDEAEVAPHRDATEHELHSPVGCVCSHCTQPGVVGAIRCYNGGVGPPTAKIFTE
jgi:hypothetical protein